MNEIMKKISGILPAASAAAAAGFLFAGYGFFEYACRRKNRRFSASKENKPASVFRQKHREARDKLLKVPYIETWITSGDGLRLKGKYYPCENAQRAVLCAHGYNGSAEGDFGTIAGMLKEDSVLLLIDERACGESEGKYITFGAKEKEDIVRWASKLVSMTEGKLPVYLFGISMGAASVLMTADQPLPSQVKGIIADCGYTSMKKILSEVIRDWYRLPSFPFIEIVSLFCRIRGHFRMRDADAEKAIQSVSVPVLFLHGLADNFVRPHHTEENAAACACEHEIILFENAPHGSSCVADPQRYKEALYRFFQRADDID